MEKLLQHWSHILNYSSLTLAHFGSSELPASCNHSAEVTFFKWFDSYSPKSGSLHCSMNLDYIALILQFKGIWSLNYLLHLIYIFTSSDKPSCASLTGPGLVINDYKYHSNNICYECLVALSQIYSSQDFATFVNRFLPS